MEVESRVVEQTIIQQYPEFGSIKHEVGSIYRCYNKYSYFWIKIKNEEIDCLSGKQINKKTKKQKNKKTKTQTDEQTKTETDEQTKTEIDEQKSKQVNYAHSKIRYYIKFCIGPQNLHSIHGITGSDCTVTINTSYKQDGYINIIHFTGTDAKDLSNLLLNHVVYQTTTAPLISSASTLASPSSLATQSLNILLDQSNLQKSPDEPITLTNHILLYNQEKNVYFTLDNYAPCIKFFHMCFNNSILIYEPKNLKMNIDYNFPIVIIGAHSFYTHRRKSVKVKKIATF